MAQLGRDAPAFFCCAGQLRPQLSQWHRAGRPFLAGNLSSSIFGPSGLIPVAAGLSAWAWSKPAINIKVNGPDGLYNKFGVQVASNPDGPFAEKTANPTGVNWLSLQYCTCDLIVAT
jgi:hypothetical protein